MTANAAWFALFLHPTPAGLEGWLEEQALRGLIPERLRSISAVRMRLTATAPATVRYVIDPQRRADDNYRATYEDAGWEYVGDLVGLRVWRKRYTGRRPEAFTDAASVWRRDVRLAWATGIVSAALLISAALRAGLGLAHLGTSSSDWQLETLVRSLIGLPLAALTVVLLRRGRWQ